MDREQGGETILVSPVEQLICARVSSLNSGCAWYRRRRPALCSLSLGGHSRDGQKHTEPGLMSQIVKV